MLNLRKTFGMLDRCMVEDLHVLSIEGGTPLAALPESSVPVWAAGTFAVGDQRYQLSTHTIYVCIKAHTTAGSTPPSQDAVNWKAYKPTERWRLFDLYRSTTTDAVGQLKVVLRPLMLVDTIDLQGVRATECEVSVTDGVGGPAVLPPTTYSLTGVNVTDWEAYFYSPSMLDDSLHISGIPFCGDPVITVHLKFPDNTVELGMLSVGMLQEMGWTEYDADIGITSYSTIKEGVDGSLTLLRRTPGGYMNVSVLVEPADGNMVAAMLVKYDGVPTLCVAHPGPEFAPLRKVGFAELSLQYPNFAERRLTGRVKGVI